ncbi:bifunctional ADP-dependent NAD(P)H-hydrate dehydratase/NAD(P)H-hydrate epimerase [Rothia kristinae]|uniref:bifunctional ADP-dependent NAD(P)H-hydrate dehydratase/NAD(P)H-hydrate epimerase n=1 Tax=Rothia kristinae TaxID=37923 RepID=UPI00092C0786|nr:bifunctional ADP-dependent NAD(P)H-hydrate dehydratase/NAD(P)H-hydrate epimerase [Rothia kristinae]MCA1170025.1 bifunctional ADP-dependent NAD(P)H-hydrate dehydratase/NAD(P)H-hydrate epimerase [Rothia kristinae]MED6045629.1 NAD(P)H-hydrate epimerase [Rothia kristinae]SIM30699.1 bifunctional NAD(P)H-hydrate repair enzyme Nnr [Mycobacteroides abscessus subsp. abscessus]
MVLNAYTAAQITATEKPHLAAGAPLMARAAHALAVEAARMLRHRPSGAYGADVVVLAGAGNNGGDALHAGALLRARGARVTAVLTGSKAHEEGLAALRGAGGFVLGLGEAGAPACARAAACADLIIDGMLGTGGRGGLREAPAELVRRIQESTGRNTEHRNTEHRSTGHRSTGGWARPLVLACDVPSGLDATTGAVAGPVLAADATVTFIGIKSGLLATPKPSLVGRIRCADLGIGADLPAPALREAEEEDFPRYWSLPVEGDQKYSRGVLGTVAGSDQYPGAGLMCVHAAVRAGAGMVRFVGGDALASALAVSTPEAVRSEHVGAHRVQAWAVGSGATDRAQQAQVEQALDAGVPVLADAAAIEMLAHRAADGDPAPAHVLLTPHAGELAQALEWVARLAPERGERLVRAAREAGLPEDEEVQTSPSRAQIEAAPFVWVRAAREALGGTLLLKGTTTLVAAPDGTVWAHRGNSAWLSTAGSGDTLSGILGAGLAAHWARVEAGRAEGADGEWAGVAAAGLLVQRGISTAAPGPVPPTVAAERIPEVLGRLADGQ